MSGLKFGKVSGDVDSKSYIDFVEKLFDGKPSYFSEIDDDSSKDIVRNLIEIADKNSSDLIYLNRNGDEEVCDSGKVNVKVNFDSFTNVKGREKRRINIDMPSDELKYLSYLDKYIDKVVELNNAGDAEATRKFLFGVMLLTRCM